MRKAFTLIELIFVIIIFGILSSFGADILYKIYENYIYSNTFNRLENQSEAAVKQIANRLQYRIKDSTIARVGTGGGILEIGDNITGATVLEWIGSDIDGWRGTIDTTAPIDPDWSGFIDLAVSTPTELNAPGNLLPNGTTGALFFIGSDVDLNSDFGWGGGIGDQNGAMHPIKINAAGNIESDVTGIDFTGVDVFEYYQYSKSAYAVSLEGSKLYFYHDFEPWNGDDLSTAGIGKSLITENVSSFKFTSMGDIMIIQVCVDDGNITGVGAYSICKEKVVF